MQRFISLKKHLHLLNGSYDSAVGWVVFNLFAPGGLSENISNPVARVGISTEQRKQKSNKIPTHSECRTVGKAQSTKPMK